MLSDIVQKAQNISLKWKLVFPFLLFSFVGTTALVYIGLTSQQVLIKKEEQKDILKLYHIFLAAMEHKEEQALSLATTVAQDPQVQSLLAERNKEALIKRLTPLYGELRRDFGISQFHLHVPPGKSFLRLHLLEEWGEMISYRKTVVEAMRGGRGVAGLEWGLTGLGIRGVVPVFYLGALVGSVEIGFPFDRPFLERLKRDWGPDFTVYEKKGEGLYVALNTTLEDKKPFPLVRHLKESNHETPFILIAPEHYPNRSILLGPIRDYLGQVVALVKIDVNRSAINQRLSKVTYLMVMVGGIGLFLSFGLTWLVASLFIRPIKEIVGEAHEIARGKRESRLHPRPADEVGLLTQSLNTMLESLKERRRQIEEYARTLEVRVRERTADLVASEEKYRKLVENLPLIVYRILNDGTTEFINPYFTEKLGYTPEEVVGNKNFWWEVICGYEGVRYGDFLKACWEQGKEYRVERVVKAKDGRLLTFIDHAMPNLDRQGQVKWVDGIMVEITELKKLQERALRTEEIRVLGEISTRFAHEIRNPLATAGGFARRLRDALPEDDPHRKIAQIIVEEVARLEDILQIILTSIEPFTLCISDVDIHRVLRGCLEDMEDQLRAEGIEVAQSFCPSLPMIQGDEGLLSRAFDSLLRHAVISLGKGERIQLSTASEGDQVVIAIRHRAEGLGEEDLEQFFLPRFASREGSAILDLPLSKIIIHRHGGKVDISPQGEGEGMILLRIELPLKSPDSGAGSFPTQTI